ncbi:MAG: adenylate/guanylate cyclase domain-containing protein [Myxococcota bacterium]
MSPQPNNPRPPVNWDEVTATDPWGRRMTAAVSAALPWYRSIAFRFVWPFTALYFVLGLTALYFLVQRENRNIQEKFGLALRTAAVSAVPYLRGDDLDAIHGNDDVSGEAFQRVRERLHTAQLANNLKEDQVYILREAPPGSGQYQFVVMLQQRTFVGDPYRPPPAVAAHYRNVLDRAASEQTDVFQDEHGWFISGMAPVRRADGSVAGILQMDYGVEMYVAELQREALTLLAGLGFMLLVVVAFGAYMRRWLHHSVAVLLRGTRAIEREQYDYVIDVEGEDELSAVGAALNKVLSKLKERFEMLKFLPKHTAKMIQAAVTGDGVKLQHAMRKKLTVLNSDIRGFTALGEQLPPERVIELLNEYIRVQAELVHTYGGSVDKYMGDAVLAVFEGHQAERAALEASVRIQEQVARMNADGRFQTPVLVGIGLTVGEVVMGNMGSHERMEHTVIGSTVNLSARLCSAAGPGEIVMTEELMTAAGPVDGLDAGQPEEVSVKGFENKVRVYRARAVRVAAMAANW